ncbi:hypothetical protein SAMN05443247_03036 [Bradyrhizobium erythrophlei]|jgi:hypothetical protein|nr:hypothetical protein SAMN05443247_03036 [Bradyrhizobium erythrophlei]
MREDHQAELDRHFAWFEGRLPPRPARLVGWLRKPSSRYAGIPLAILLIVGGVFSFLPVLGLWMLPLGLLLFAQDVPVLQQPMAECSGGLSANGSRASVRKARGESLQSPFNCHSIARPAPSPVVLRRKV